LAVKKVRAATHLMSKMAQTPPALNDAKVPAPPISAQAKVPVLPMPRNTKTATRLTRLTPTNMV